MHPQQLKKKAARPLSSRATHRTSGRSTSYLKTRIRGSRLRNAARILVLVELTQRLHQACEHAYDKQAADRLLPQNPTPLTQDQINKVQSDITETLKNPGCAKFVAATLNQVASDTSIPLFSDDVLKNFNEVARTGTLEATLLSGREAQAWGSAGGGDAKIQFNNQYPLTSPFPHVVGLRGIHETTHVSSNKRMYTYSDYDLARASYKVALKLGYKGVPKPPDTLDAIENGNYYSDRLFNACRPVWQRSK
jgi:hypothetical protein